MRTLPNIIVTGTPGVGKTTTCTQLVGLSADDATAAAATALPRPSPLRHLEINRLVKEKGFHEGFDEVSGSWIVDEERVLDEVEGVLGEGERKSEEDEDEDEDGEGKRGGWLIDWHACDLFPRAWVDLVVVLRCERTEVFWERLKARAYAENKLQENMDAEIFGVLAEEAREAFDKEMVVELKSETVEDVDSNCERILHWIQSWREERPSKAHGKKS